MYRKKKKRLSLRAMVVSSRSLRFHASAILSLSNDYVGTQGMVINPFPTFPWDIPLPSKPIRFPANNIPLPTFPPMMPPTEEPEEDCSDKKKDKKKKVKFASDLVDLEVVVPSRTRYEKCLSSIFHLHTFCGRYHYY